MAGAQFLRGILRTGNAGEQSVSQIALKAYSGAESDDSKAAVASAALSAVAGQALNSGGALADVALGILSQVAPSESKSRSRIGSQFLEGILQTSQDPSELAVCKIAAEASHAVDNFQSKAALCQTALNAIKAGLEGRLDARLAQVGASSLAQIDPSELTNRASLAKIFVTAVGQNTADPALRSGSETALKKAEATPDYSEQGAILSDFLSFIGKLAPPLTVKPEPAAAPPVSQQPTPSVATTSAAAAAAPATAAVPALDEATSAELKKVKEQLMAEWKPTWGARLDSDLAKHLATGTVPAPKQLSSSAFAEEWAQLEPKVSEATQKSELLGKLPAEQLKSLLGSEALRKSASEIPAPLTFGETFSKAEVPSLTYTADTDANRDIKKKLIEKMVRFVAPADATDAHLVRRCLNACPAAMLQELDKAKYTITVSRDRISNAEKKLVGRFNVAGELHDLDESAQTYEQDLSPRILVRSHWKKGEVHLDPESLLFAIGRAYNTTVLGKGNVKYYPSSKADMEAARKAESGALPASLQNGPEFAAEIFSRNLLDPERCARQFPLASDALAKNNMATHKIDKAAIAELQKSKVPVVNIVSGDPYAELRKLEELNRVQRAKGLPILPYRFEIQGSEQHNVGALVDQLGEVLRESRHPGQPSFHTGEAAVRIPSATFNSPDQLEKLLNEQVQSGRGAFLVLDDLASVQAGSPGFPTLSRYMERFGGQTPLLLQGSAADLDRLREALPTAIQKRFTTQPLTAAMIGELAGQAATNQGYRLSAEAQEALGKKARDGELAQMASLWGGVKAAQTERTMQILPYLEGTPEAVRRVTLADVKNAKTSREKDPLEEMERMVGLGNAKREVRNVLAQVALQKQQEKHGMTAERPRLNLLFEGNPGTGKTTVAKLFADALTRVGYLKNNKFKEVRVQDLVTGNPEENVKKLFEGNKGGVIFVDEMHQLKDTPEGKRAFRAMIPYLGHPEYADTVFIGAGYKGEMRDLIRDVDDGAERRFSSVPFDDYTRDELGSILDKMSVDKERVLDAPTREAALMRLERERRKMKNFGNAGSVGSMLELAIKKQTSRLSHLQDVKLTKELLMGLIPDDFAAEKVLTPAEVWQEIDALEGLHDLKDSLRTICSSIEYDKEMGKDPLESFEPYFILDGPPGTGKTTMARLIVKLMSAYDIIPSHGLTETQGADLQAGYIGQTTTKVQKLFESMWGQGGFIDEVGGLARAPEAFQADAAKTMLKQMEDHRGRFILVVADYADRVNEFLNIDPGIARRFGNRFSLEPLTAEGAVTQLTKKLAEKDLHLNEETTILVQTRMKELHAAPGWASSGDVRKLLNTIITQQKTAFMAARKKGIKLDPKLALPEALTRGFDTLIKEKNAKGEAPPNMEDQLRQLLGNR